MLTKKIVTHEKPHLDEISAIWLLRKFGGKLYPGVETASIEFEGNNNDRSAGQKTKEEGVLYVGVGGGEFDEHPSNGQGPKPGTCAALEVAKKLGVVQDPALKQLLDYVTLVDTKGTANPLDLATLIKNLHEQFPNKPLEVIAWAIVGLEAKYAEQQEFWGRAKKEFEEKAESETIVTGQGSKILLVAIESDCTQVGRYAMHKGAGIVIQRNSSGLVQVRTKKGLGLNLIETIAILRIEEQRAKGQVVVTDPKQLRSDGAVPGVEEWYFQKVAQAALNGSLTATGVPRTKLTLEQIKRAVRLGINGRLLPQHCATSLKCLGSTCSWHPYKLFRCQEVRQSTFKAA